MKFLMFAASLRKGSMNKKLIQEIAQKAMVHKIDVEIMDYNQFEMPLYNGDLEGQERSEGHKLFLEKMSLADAVVVASPEYNYSMPGTLKNIIDWTSRDRPMPWQKAKVLLAATSPGGAGGREGLRQLRVPLEGLGAYVFPQLITVPSYMATFSEEGRLVDERSLSFIDETLEGFASYVKKLS